MLGEVCRRTPSCCPDAPHSYSTSALISSCFLSSPWLALSGWSAQTQWNTWSHRQTHHRAPRWCPACDGAGRALANGTRPSISSARHSPHDSQGHLSKTLKNEQVLYWVSLADTNPWVRHEKILNSKKLTLQEKNLLKFVLWIWIASYLNHRQRSSPIHVHWHLVKECILKKNKSGFDMKQNK